MYVENATTFAGYPVVDWNPEDNTIEDWAGTAVAIRTDWDDDQKGKGWMGKFNALLKHPEVGKIPALVVGMWHYEDTILTIVDALVDNKKVFASLKAIFLGDITSEENEISWIKQDDVSSLWGAYPNLEYLTIRGGDGLKLGEIKLPKLKSLRIESGGLNAEVVRAVGEAKLPELESLVLWLGTSGYGATSTIADLKGFYDCAGFPKLKYLGLCDSEMANAVAEFMATAPALERLDVLDLSLGVLNDEGALALLTSPNIHNLKKLDIHHHFCSRAMVDKLEAMQKDSLEVDASDRQTDNDWRFVAVGE
jgi:hypothetical protein